MILIKYFNELNNNNFNNILIKSHTNSSKAQLLR